MKFLFVFSIFLSYIKLLERVIASSSFKFVVIYLTNEDFNEFIYITIIFENNG